MLELHRYLDIVYAPGLGCTLTTAFQPNTMNFATYFQGKKRTHSHCTDPMTFKSMLKRAQNPFTDQSTPCPPLNSQPCENSLKNIPGMVSSAHVSLHGAALFYSSKRMIVASIYAWTSVRYIA